MTATDLLKWAVAELDKGDNTPEVDEWLVNARAVLKPAIYDIFSVDAELVERPVDKGVIGERATMERLCQLARQKALRMPNKPHTGITGANECSIFIGLYRVWTFKAVKVA